LTRRLLLHRRSRHGGEGKSVRKLGDLPPDQFALIEQAVHDWLVL
jgi:hypothetical protein